MSKSLEEIILQAIDIIATKKITSAGYDKTILATIISCQDEKTGKYKIKYQDSFLYAYNNNINITYSNGANVYVLIPKGDMSQDKTILGGVKQLGVNYKNIAGGNNQDDQGNMSIHKKSIYVLNGQNLISNNDILSLCSYKTETKVLYSKDIPIQENLIKINTSSAKEYISNSNALAISIDIQNNLDFQQRYEGNYGVLVGLDFKDNATRETVTRYYALDIDSMTGNPYYYPNIVNQSQVFDIDGSNFEQINFISLFIKDFPNQSETKDDDIFISNFQIGGATVLSQNDLSSYSLNIITPKGYIFNEYSSNEEERILQPQLRSKGKVVEFNKKDMSIYWFMENATVTTKNKKYSKYGGQGWACLNEYGIIQEQVLDADGELVSPAIQGFLPAQVNYLTIKKSEILAKTTKFKCVVVYNENILSKEISILRHDSEYDIYVISDSGTKFYYDSGSPTLTCYCKHKEPNNTYIDVDIDNLKFVWSSINNNGNFSSLESQQGNDKEKLILIKQNILSYLDLEYIALEDIVDISVLFPSDYEISELQDEELKTQISNIKQNFISNDIKDEQDIETLFNTYDIETGNSITYDLLLNGDINHNRTITKAIENYSNNQKVVENKILNLSVRNITKFTTFKCSVFTKIGERYLGTGSITITNSLSVENQYSLIINNGNQLFKYNTHGIAPTSKRLANPQQIPILNFSLYDPQGNEIEEQKLLTADISWTIPVKDTLLKANNSYEGGIPSSDLETITYKKLMTFSYTIAESYNIKKTNNNIQLKIVYNGMTLTASTNLIFTKEGQQGTNGTQFVCKIIPNVESGDTPVYPTIYYDGTNVSFNWDQDRQKPWFKVQLWHNDFEPIFVGTSSGNSIEDKLVTIEKWEVLKNTYKKSIDEALLVQDQTNLTVVSNDSNDGWTFGFNPGTLQNSWDTSEYEEWRPANILKVTLNYDGNIYYGTLPVIVCRLFDANYYRAKLQDYTGFQHVLYSSAGIDPSYDSHAPFEIITEQLVDGKWNDISLNGINYNFLYVGSVWYRKKQNGSYIWQEQFEETDNDGESSKKWLKKRYIGTEGSLINQKVIQPVERYNGECVNIALVCEIVRENDGKVLAWMHMPIHFSFNRFENSAINDWDGNSIDLGATNGGTILAPQAGMGYKDENNKFTGVLMGTVKDPDVDTTNQLGSKSNEQNGLFAYHQGVRTAFIDAKTGKSTFGQEGQAQIIIDPTQTNSLGRKVAQIKSGNYDENEGTGLLIDLSTPEIKYGSGNFNIDKDGKLYAKGAYIDGSLSVNTVINDDESEDKTLKSIFQGIDLKVSQIDSLEERVSQAELKITDSAIVSTVTSSSFGQKVNSTIEQTSEGIYLKAKYISWNSTYSSMTKDGKLTCQGANINGDITMKGDYLTVNVGYRDVPVSAGFDTPYSKQNLEGLLYEKFHKTNGKRIGLKYIGYYDAQNMMEDSTVTSYYGYARTITCNRVGESGIPSNFNNSTSCHMQEMLYRHPSWDKAEYSLTLYKGNFQRCSHIGMSDGSVGASIWESNSLVAGLDINNASIRLYTKENAMVVFDTYLYIGTTDGNYSASYSNQKCGFYMQYQNDHLQSFRMGNWHDSNDKQFYGYLNVSDPYLYFGGKYVQFQSSSSKRYKHNIELLKNIELNPHRLLNLQVKQFIYNDKYVVQYGDMRDKVLPGFIAEDVAEIYPSAAIYNHEGEVESWDERRIIPGMLALIQELYQRIEKIENNYKGDLQK